MVNLSICSTRSYQVRLIIILGILIKLRITAGQIFLKTLFFPYTIIQWNKLDVDVLKSKSYAIFRNTLLKLGRSKQNAICNINNPVALKVLTLLRLGLSHLNKNRFNHNFQNCINPLCSCSLEIVSTSHFFTALPSLYQHLFNSLKQYS